MAKIKEIIQVMETFAPIDLQADFDNCGLKTGNVEDQVTGILVTLDTNEAVVKEAIRKKCNLIIEHHPSIFNPIKALDYSLPLHKAFMLAIANGIAIYSAHTNVDFTEGGLNDYVASQIGLLNIYAIDSPSGPRIGSLQHEISLQDYAKVIGKIFQDKHITYIGEPNRKIKNVAVVNGGGGGSTEDLLLAVKAHADVFITGDIKYNVARLAKDAKYAIIQFGHYDSELGFMPLIGKLMRSKFPDTPVFETNALENPYN